VFLCLLTKIPVPMTADFVDAVTQAVASCRWLPTGTADPSLCCTELARLLEQVPAIDAIVVWSLANAGLINGVVLPALLPDAEGLECLYHTTATGHAGATELVVQIGSIAWLALTFAPEVSPVVGHQRLKQGLQTFAHVLHGALAQRALQRERTQLTHAEARLRELRSRSDSATSYRAMGHDFNNILASILGFAEPARESLQDGEIEEIDSHLVEVKPLANEDATPLPRCSRLRAVASMPVSSISQLRSLKPFGLHPT